MGIDGFDIKIAVDFQQREGGGLRATSPDVPGLILSSENVGALLSDVAPAIEHLLKMNHGLDVEMRPLTEFKTFLAERGLIEHKSITAPTQVEFSGRMKAA